MTLATVSRYERDRVANVGERAVVVGASMAGLLAARVLADGFERVTVLERDSLGDDRTTRRGVPQGRHAHALLESGRVTIEDLFPGYGEELLSAGGMVIDQSADLRHYEKGGFLADGPERVPMYCATRPLFEGIVRRRVAALDGVDVRPGRQFVDYAVGDTEAAIEGTVIRDENGDRSTVPADLVVDATGRTSRTPSWLDDHGYAPPPVDEVTVDLAYSTALIERPTGDRRTFFVTPDAPRTRGVVMMPVEDGRWLLTAIGVHGDHPPTDPDGLTAFVASLPVTEPGRLLEERPWASDEIAHYPFPANRRHRYEALDRFPDGLLVVGDAVSSFNPIYGQGISVAALEAVLLHRMLATGGRADLARRFFDRAEEVVDVPWSIAVGGDFEFSQTEGPKPTGTDLFNRYLARLMRRAHTDGALRDPLIRVFNMERPPTDLFRPGVAWRVLRPTRSAIGSNAPDVSTGESKKTP